jgi:apolipoprotein N-acyltransferase
MERFFLRLPVALGLAGLWVLLEWLRSWLFSGFPWLPLSASQWERPAMLQLAAYGGHYAVSFVLVFFNLAVAQYVMQICHGAWGRKHLRGLKQERVSLRFCGEFYLAMIGVAASALIYVQAMSGTSLARVPLADVAVVQPWIPASTEPWTSQEAMAQLDLLARLSLDAVHSPQHTRRPDFVLWHETAPPFHVDFDDPSGLLGWLENLSQRLQTTIVFGAGMADLDAKTATNALFAFQPGSGLGTDYHIKRKLVPFGEYIPFRQWLGWIGQVVPAGLQTQAGKEAKTFRVAGFAGEGTVHIGGLICYEDIFAHLARDQALAGANLLAVVTNDAWYGTEGGAIQHAAHSVLRAVETRRPVVRAGNHGVSSWIDEWGNVRATLTDTQGNPYTRGWARFELDQDPHLAASQSVYVRWGDWFVLVSGLLAIAGAASLYLCQSRRRPSLPLHGN